ncbi:hypothetical protein LX13_003982 [Williamsia maris]|uniref:Uncharacterized protein n=1 Tax=Williamsia maris TaxID=72806 RepID=A0ABT1HJN0_9NOCA|nr:hypothetical protein [Williamsia maris]
MVITTPPSLVVRVDAFEYGCCRQPPAVGETITGTLSAQPTTSDRSSLRVTGWDRGRDLVTVDGVVARWDSSRGNPIGQPVGICLSWHSDGVPGVDATATIASVSQIYLGTEQDAANGETLHLVERVEQFPEPLLTPAGVLQPGGAVLTLTDLVLVEPTREQVVDHLAALEVSRRTIHITAPPTYFGSIVPDRGNRITVDLDDPAAQIHNRPTDAGGLVTGITRQVSEAVPVGSNGMMVFRRAPAHTPTANITNHMFVVLVLDESTVRSSRVRGRMND